MAVSLSKDEQIAALQQEIVTLKSQLQTYKDLVDDNIEQIHSVEEQGSEKAEQKSDESRIDWSAIHDRFIAEDERYILELMHSKKVDIVNDVDPNGHSLWSLSCGYGLMTPVKMCINFGVDANRRDAHGNDGLFYARKNQHYDVVQYLVLHKIGAGKAEEIVKDCSAIWDEDGVLAAFLHEMDSLAETDADCVRRSLVNVVVRMIEQQLPISSFLQNLSMVFDAPKTWKSIEAVMDATIRNTADHKSWYYLNKYLLNNNTLLFRRYLLTQTETTEQKTEDTVTSVTSSQRELCTLNTNEMQYFLKTIFLPMHGINDEHERAVVNNAFESEDMSGAKLTAMNAERVKAFLKSNGVEEECATKIAPFLSNQRKQFYAVPYIAENEYGFDKMYEKALTASADTAQKDIAAMFDSDDYKTHEAFIKNYGKQYHESGVRPRQDTIEHGIKAKFSKAFLVQNMSKQTSFNPILFYDIEVYLDELMLQCAMINDHFQSDAQRIFMAHPNYPQSVDFRRGPLKLVQRCKVKVEGDYWMEAYPTAACLVDIVRCTVVFSDFMEMMDGIKLFEQQIEQQSTCIKSIVRIKNGFIDCDTQSPNYIDIKFNVRIYCSNGVHIIGEVQFLLQRMAEFKVKAHKYYNIMRKKEYFSNLKQVSLIKNNSDKQLMVAAKTGDHKTTLDILIKKQVRTLTDLQRINILNSALTQIYKHGHIKSLKVFLSLCGNATEIGVLLSRKVDSSDKNQNGALIAAKYGRLEMLKFILSFENCQHLLHSADDRGRTPFIQACWNAHIGCIKFILSKLGNPTDPYGEKMKLFQSMDDYGKSGLMLAAWKGYENVVRLILSECKTEQERRELIQMRELGKTTGQTVFVLAVIGGALNVIRLLLSHFADDTASVTEMLYNYKRNALMLAVINKKLEIVQFLLSICDPDKKMKLIEQQDFYGNNIFLLACQYEHEDVAECILQQLDGNQSKLELINSRNKNGQTALEYATKKRHFEVGRTVQNWIKQFADVQANK